MHEHELPSEKQIRGKGQGQGLWRGVGNRQHATRLGEEGEGQHLAVELHQRLVLGVGNGAHLRPSPDYAARDV
eukprot:3890852-Heterocapsa_arctica.AAC.1